MDEALLDQLHVPTGLDIGAETAAEIALSILPKLSRSSLAGHIPRVFARQQITRMPELYSDILLDHFRHPRNYGSLVAPDISNEQFNPLCGDRIRIELKLEQSIVTRSSFKGDACAICTAAASLLTELVLGERS